jgi:small subunit ribosomal protein S6
MAEKRIGSCRDIPGRTREYETIFILKPDTTNDVIGQSNTKIRHVIEAGGGQLLKVENWGRRKLAYEVKKQLKGIYVFFNYLGGAGLVEEVERNLHLTDAVIRYYTVKAAENVDAATKTSAVTDETFASASVPGPDEEAIATGQAGARPFGDEAVFGKVDEPVRRGG